MPCNPILHDLVITYYKQPMNLSTRLIFHRRKSIPKLGLTVSQACFFNAFPPSCVPQIAENLSLAKNSSSFGKSLSLHQLEFSKKGWKNKLGLDMGVFMIPLLLFCKLANLSAVKGLEWFWTSWLLSAYLRRQYLYWYYTLLSQTMPKSDLRDW